MEVSGMFGGVLAGLIIAYILTMFYVDDMVIEVFNSFNLSIVFTISHYYILFALIGLIGGIFSK